tara:strand:+ start:3742 stop:4311 length:570 start_codon:yes stop_codon:yes gene_type:complete
MEQEKKQPIQSTEAVQTDEWVPDSRDAMLERMQRDFPHTFFPYTQPIKPLAYKITESLNAHYKGLFGEDFDVEIISKAVAFYCRRNIYLRGVVREDYRINLEGEAAQEVSEGDKYGATSLLEARQRWKEERAKKTQADKEGQKSEKHVSQTVVSNPAPAVGSEAIRPRLSLKSKPPAANPDAMAQEVTA